MRLGNIVPQPQWAKMTMGGGSNMLGENVSQQPNVPKNGCLRDCLLFQYCAEAIVCSNGNRLHWELPQQCFATAIIKCSCTEECAWISTCGTTPSLLTRMMFFVKPSAPQPLAYTSDVIILDCFAQVCVSVWQFNKGHNIGPSLLKVDLIRPSPFAKEDLGLSFTKAGIRNRDCCKKLDNWATLVLNTAKTRYEEWSIRNALHGKVQPQCNNLALDLIWSSIKFTSLGAIICALPTTFQLFTTL